MRSFQVLLLCFFGAMIKNVSQPMTFCRPLLHAVAMAVAGLLLPLVWLREDQRFWTDAGGYPFWLRNLVLVAYHPLLFLEVGLLAFLSWLLVRRPARSVAWFGAEAVALLLLWAVVALVLALMLANNIANLFDGRPLHEH